MFDTVEIVIGTIVAAVVGTIIALFVVDLTTNGLSDCSDEPTYCDTVRQYRLNYPDGHIDIWNK